ncbi:MAG: hypothetical protein L0Z07_02580, partial [Planctomycetes bacterium]|nr:hypothetical protein [Planctomycetota bacterium]
MNAKRMRAICAAVNASLLSMCITQPSYATGGLDLLFSTAVLSQVSGQQQLSRNDVDKLLQQARAAIQQGNLDQAEAILRRTEQAGVHYPLLHIGSTPASVRRELAKAQRTSAPAKPSATAQPADRYPQNARQPVSAAQQANSLDPFARRNPSLPAAPATQPLPPSMNPGGISDPSAINERRENELPALAQPPGNPFSPAAGNGMALEADANSWHGMPETLPVAPLPTNTENAGTLAASTMILAPRAISPAPGAPVQATPDKTPKQQALKRLAAARQALDAGNLELAEQFSREASAMNLAESQFLPNEDRPSLLAWDILRARDSQQSVQPAVQHLPAGEPRYTAQPASGSVASTSSNQLGTQAISLGPADGAPRLALVPDELNLPPQSAGQLPDANTSEELPALNAVRLMQQAETALRSHDRQQAQELFNQAHLLREQLDPAAQQRLQERLQQLSMAEPANIAATPASPQGSVTPLVAATPPVAAAPPAGSASGSTRPPNAATSEISATPSLLDAASNGEQVVARQLSATVGKQQSEARRLREKDPQKALAMLQESRQQVEKSKVSEEYRSQLLRRLDITIRETERYFDDHRVEIELDQQNAAVVAEVDRNREVEIKVQEKIAELVDEYNKLKDEQRFAEMEIVAQRLRDLAPDEQVAQQIWLDAKFIRREIMNRDLVDRREDSFWVQLNAVEESAVNPVGANGRELAFDQKYWEQFAKNRKGLDDLNSRRTERELEIERRLKTPVQLKYQDTPLSKVIDDLSQLSGVNIHLDPLGLSQEGVNTDTSVTVNLNQEVQLKSALHLILEPLHLSYVVKDEVLKITSEQLRDGELVTATYNVADLVVPIPNFVPSNNIGLQGLINDSYSTMNQNPMGMPGAAVLVNGGKGQPGTAAGNDQVLAQQFNAGPANTLSPTSVPIGSGPGGMGGGANADFDSLIDLIVSTVSTETWAENGGGEAEIRPFPTNLSLVISQTQSVHEEIADLLAQLRRLQDLQVTIEVRYIRLNDRFFERIGIDFDMNIESNTNPATAGSPTNTFEPTQSATVGLQTPVAPISPFPNFTSDLDVPFRQEHFDLTQLTPFGGGTRIASFGFAILSDIEAYFLIEAAQGDSRTNVLSAPKVTLFNGQQAFVADSTQRPFVMGVIPVVGEFAAAQQPVIVVLNEGTMMTIQAVVSDDRRYVRLTVVPFFTQIGDVDEFTFEGSSSTTSSSSSTSDDDDKSESKD